VGEAYKEKDMSWNEEIKGTEVTENTVSEQNKVSPKTMNQLIKFRDDKSRSSLFSNNVKSMGLASEHTPVFNKPPLNKESVSTYRQLKKELLRRGSTPNLDNRRSKSTQDTMEA
jgi:hypothetical protein